MSIKMESTGMVTEPKKNRYQGNILKKSLRHVKTRTELERQRGLFKMGYGVSQKRRCTHYMIQRKLVNTRSRTLSS